MRFFRLLFSVSLVGISACEKPGEGPKAERGFARGHVVIAALDSFHRARAHYPDSLTQLLPAFIDSVALATPAHPQEHYPWSYTRKGDTYELQFRYVGPGMNECTYRSVARDWKCRGYY